MDRHIVIVDPLSTGRELAPAFAARGVKAIAVLSNVVIAPTYIPSWEPENFDLILGWNGTDAGLEQLVATLTPFAPIAVIAGAEIGVILGDRLGARLAPATGNDPATSLNRRDKGDMGSAVAAAGIPALRQLCTADPEAAAAWIGENGLDRARLVLKPSNSSLTDEVHFVEPGAPWRPAFDRILASTNALGLRNTQVLVQEFAEGVEYIVDLYSVDGAHGLVDVCRYTKASRKDSEGGHRIGIYERVDFLPPDSPRSPICSTTPSASPTPWASATAVPMPRSCSPRPGRACWRSPRARPAAATRACAAAPPATARSTGWYGTCWTASSGPGSAGSSTCVRRFWPVLSLECGATARFSTRSTGCRRCTGRSSSSRRVTGCRRRRGWRTPWGGWRWRTRTRRRSTPTT
ncbi:hypothetical protein ACFQ9X_29360 [Catenulispora yoronensis]